MALNINNTLQPSLSTLGGMGGTSATTPTQNSTTVLGQLSAARNAYANKGFPTITGLVSPSHPAVGSLNTGSPIATHTVTTNPDNSVTSKVTYANDGGSTTTGGSSNSTTTTPTLPPAPVATIANTAFQVNPATLPGLTGGNYGNGTGAQQTTPTTTNGNPYTPQLATAATTGSPTAQGYTAQTAQYGAGNIPIEQQAQNIANQYGQQIATVGEKGAGFEGGQLTTGTSPVATGNAAVTAQTTAAQQQSLATGENAALAGIGYQLTGQNQAANAANAAAGQAYTGQGLVQSGLGTAAGYAQPQTTTPGQAVFNPTTGQYTSASSGGGNAATAPSGIDQGAWSQYVTDLSNGAVSAIPSSITGNANLMGQLQQAVSQSNPGFNYNTAVGTASGQTSGAAATAAAPGTATGQNIVTARTAETNALQAVYGQNAPAAYNLNTALNNIQSLGSLTLQTQAGGNINPLSTQVGNQTIAQFKASLGSASQATFNSNMTAFSSALSALYADQSGATPTQVGVWQSQIASGSMPMQQLQAVYSAAISEGGLRLSNLRATASSAYSAEQGSTGAGSTATSTSWSNLGG